MFIGYVQNNNDQEDHVDQYKRLTSFAKKQGIVVGCVYVDNDFKNIKDVITPDCEGILITKISDIGSCLQDIKDILLFFQEKNLKLFSIDDGYVFDKINLTKDFFKGIDVAINIRSTLISQSTRKVLNQRRREGKSLGRPVGSKVKSKLEKKSSEIKEMLERGVSKSEISKQLGINRVSIYAFAKRHGISFSKS